MAKRHRNIGCTQNCSTCAAVTTIHKSGLCKACRSRPCQKCDKPTISVSGLCVPCGAAKSRNHIKSKNQSLRQALFTLMIVLWPSTQSRNGFLFVSPAGSLQTTLKTGEIAARNADKRKPSGGSSYDLQDKDQFEGDV